ncbi:MAG: NADH-quinone oxidoreductase subunit M [Betaproteobacteria bacterium]
MSGTHLLSFAIWVPVLFGLIVLATGSDRNAPLAKMLALFGAVAGLLVTVPLYTGFDMTTPAMQFVELAPWIKLFNINYHLGVDGISMLFVILNSFITVIVVLAGWKVIDSKVAQYNAAFLIMSGLMNGIFASLDAMLFYVFFEASLIPLYLIIGVWGGPNRVYAAFKFFLFTLFGSLLFLIALIYLFLYSGGSFSILDWHQLPIDLGTQIWIFLAFLVAFAVKVPMWPVHTWLPDAHVEAPTGGSIVLAAIALKLGAYGFLRFSLPIAPDASHELSWLIIGLSLIAVVYIGLVALVQVDMKKLVAYSSIAHMGFVTLGFFMFTAPASEGALGAGSALGVEGALVQMISHGFIAGAMFYCIGVMYDRVHSRLIADYGGVVNTMPKFAAFFMLFAMANAGLPATSGFVGEFMIIMAAVKFNFWVAFASATTMIVGAAYTLWMYKRVVFGDVANHHVAELSDIDGREFLILSLLALGALGMGLYPQAFTEVMHSSVNELLRHIAVSKIL